MFFGKLYPVGSWQCHTLKRGTHATVSAAHGVLKYSVGSCTKTLGAYNVMHFRPCKQLHSKGRSLQAAAAKSSALDTAPHAAPPTPLTSPKAALAALRGSFVIAEEHKLSFSCLS